MNEKERKERLDELDRQFWDEFGTLKFILFGLLSNSQIMALHSKGKTADAIRALPLTTPPRRFVVPLPPPVSRGAGGIFNHKDNQ